MSLAAAHFGSPYLCCWIADVAGVILELIHAPGETDDQILVWMPDKKVLFW
jgi:glyoxylase-like metal-dependent hydrolase (beta-lactamase superfamily II)